MRSCIVGLIVGMGVCVSGVAWAEETAPTSDAALINHPTTGWELTKKAVNYLEPGADWLVILNGGDTATGFSGAIYTATSKGFPLASLRAGYGLSDPITYGTLTLDLPGLAGRFLPSAIKGVSPGALNGALAFAAKYVRVGPMGGYRWDTNRPVWGLSIGAAVTF